MENRKSYKLRGKNKLDVTFTNNIVTFEIRDQFLTAPLSKNQAKKLISDLQKWVDGDKED